MKLALVQMEVVMSKKDRNLHRAIAGLVEAADAGAEVVVLPECCDLGWMSSRARLEAEAFDGVFVSTIAEVASAKGVYVVVGFTERDFEDIYNAAVLVTPGGEVLLHHRKINLLDMARPIYKVGTILECADTEFGRIGLTICADSWAPEPTKALSMMGAQVVLSPSAWACERGDEMNNLDSIRQRYRARATESGVFLAGCDGVGDVSEGPWKGRILEGASLVYGPGGELVAEAEICAEQILLVDIDLAEAGGVERSRKIT